MISLKKLALYSLYLYICSLYVLAYDVRLNLISRGLFMLTAGFAAMSIIKKGKIKSGIIYPMLILFMSYSFLSCFWSPDFQIAFARNMTLLQIVGLVFMVYNIIDTREELESVVQAFFWGTIIMCIQAIFIYGIPYIIDSIMSGTRLGTEINQANALGYYCAIAFLIGIYNFIYRKKKLFLLLAILPFFMAFSSGSRKTIIVIILGAALLFALKNGRINIFKISVALLLFIGVFMLIYQIDALQPFFKRFTAFIDFFSDDAGTGKDNSMVVRVDMIKFGMEQFKNRPIFGSGTEQYNVLYEQAFGIARPSHNHYIQTLVCFGVVGFCIFYGMYCYIISKLVKAISNKDRLATIVLIITIVELFSHITTDALLNKFSYIYLVVAFAYCNIADKENKESDSYESNGGLYSKKEDGID